MCVSSLFLFDMNHPEIKNIFSIKAPTISILNYIQ